MFSRGERTQSKEEINPIVFRTHPEVLLAGLKKQLSCVVTDSKVKFSGDDWEVAVAAMAEGDEDE